MLKKKNRTEKEILEPKKKGNILSCVHKIITRHTKLINIYVYIRYLGLKSFVGWTSSIPFFRFWKINSKSFLSFLSLLSLLSTLHSSPITNILSTSFGMPLLFSWKVIRSLRHILVPTSPFELALLLEKLSVLQLQQPLTEPLKEAKNFKQFFYMI